MTRRCAAILALVLVAAGCGAKTPDYQAIWSTTTTTAPSTDKPVPMASYLESAGVTGDPVAPDRLTDLTVTLPRPPGWEAYKNPNFAPGTQMIVKGDTYPTAMLLVFKLNGDFDVAEALKHADVDAQLTQNFKQLDSSDANFRGFPSSMIEGSYNLGGQRMHSYSRVVFATGSPPVKQRYLVQFTVTTYAQDAVKQAPDVEAIIRGFTVRPK